MSDFTDQDRETLDKVYNLLMNGFHTSDPANPGQPAPGSAGIFYRILQAQLSKGSELAKQILAILSGQA